MNRSNFKEEIACKLSVCNGSIKMIDEKYVNSKYANG